MNIATTASGVVIRPLNVLVPLIKKDLDAADEASERVLRPFHFAIGDKLIEAKAQLPGGEFSGWVTRHFKFGLRQAQQYMQVARSTTDAQRRSALREMEEMSFRQTVREHTTNKNYGRPASWQADIKDNVARARQEAARLQEENLSRAEERKAEKALALRLIDIGYKVLAKELHPDKGGTKDAMSRLGKVRARLKGCA